MNRTSPSYRSRALPAPSDQLLRACYRISMLTAHPFTMLPSSGRAILRSPVTSPPGPCGTCMPFTRSHHRGAVSVPCCHVTLPSKGDGVDAYDRRVPISRWNGQPNCRAVPEGLAVFEAAKTRSDGASRRRACFGRYAFSAWVGVVFPPVLSRVAYRL